MAEPQGADAGRVAYRLETARLVLRCYSPADAQARKAAVDASREHLLPSMSWAKEDPRSLEAHVSVLRRFRGLFDLDQDRFYGAFDLAEQRVLGEVALLTRGGKGVRELAYWVHAEAVGQGFATEMVGAVTRWGFEAEGLQRMDVQVEVGNDRSAAVVRRLGFHLRETVRVWPASADVQPVMIEVYSLGASEFPSSPAAKRELRAFDVLGLLL